MLRVRVGVQITLEMYLRHHLLSVILHKFPEKDNYILPNFPNRVSSLGTAKMLFSCIRFQGIPKRTRLQFRSGHTKAYRARAGFASLVLGGEEEEDASVSCGEVSLQKGILHLQNHIGELGKEDKTESLWIKPSTR
jgi:hypothetical protein